MVSDRKILTNPADLAEHQDRVEIVEDVPEWDCQLRFLTPKLNRLLSLEQARRGFKPEDPKHQVEDVVLAISACVVGEDGEPMFTTDEHLEWLRSRHPSVLVRLNSVCTRVCGPSQQGVESALGESEGTPGFESASA